MADGRAPGDDPRRPRSRADRLEPRRRRRPGRRGWRPTRSRRAAPSAPGSVMTCSRWRSRRVRNPFRRDRATSGWERRTQPGSGRRRGNRNPAAARLTGDMTDPRAASAHAAHDTMLLAALGRRFADRARSETLPRRWSTAAGCVPPPSPTSSPCDRRRVSMPTPPRPRDYHLTPADAARLRPAGWRRWVAAFGVAARPGQPAAGDRPDDARPGRAARRRCAIAHARAGRPAPAHPRLDDHVGRSQPAGVAAPELASGAPLPAADAGSRVSAAPGVAVRSARIAEVRRRRRLLADAAAGYRWNAERRPDPIRRHARRRRQAGRRGRLGERGGPHRHRQPAPRPTG